jgi:hypothetical protein
MAGAKLQATQLFEMRIALEAWHDQSHRKTACGPQRLADLTIDHEGLVQDLVGQRGNALLPQVRVGS